MTKKKARLGAIFLIIVLALFALPIWPISPSQDIWTEEDFLAHKNEMNRVARSLSNDFYKQLMDDDGIQRDGVTDEDWTRLYQEYNYQINVRYGTIRGLRSLLFGTFYQRADVTTYAFASHLKGGHPYLEYEEDGWRAYLSPQAYNKIVEQIASSNH